MTIRQISFTKRTPLSRAAEEGHGPVVYVLLDRNADVHFTNLQGDTPLHLATYRRHEDVARLLFGVEGIKTNRRNNKGLTPLAIAAQLGHSKIAQLLLSHEDTGSGVKDDDGRTPLWWIAAYGDRALVTQTIESASADVNAKDHYGQTALLRAAEYANENTVELLLGHEGVDANSRDSEGQTPLLMAVKNRHVAVVTSLLGHPGINGLSQDESGRTAYSWAVEEGQEEVRLLLDEAMASIEEADDAGLELAPPQELAEPRMASYSPDFKHTAAEPPHVLSDGERQQALQPHGTQGVPMILQGETETTSLKQARSSSSGRPRQLPTGR